MVRRILAGLGNAGFGHVERPGRLLASDLVGVLRASEPVFYRRVGGAEIPKKHRASEVFEPGIELTHIYDFGTSSETLIKVVGLREGKPTTSHPIALMARNRMPEAQCIECGQPAAWLCVECLYEEERWGTLCGAHAQTHPHDDYGEPLPLVNSPRLGMYGYDGPAEPPY